MSTYLVTGCAGFIGHRVCQMLLTQGKQVVGLDNFSDDYDLSLKRLRLQSFQGDEQFHFARLNVQCRASLEKLFQSHSLDGVIHLAARAGVRTSWDRPADYMATNGFGCLNVLDCMSQFSVGKLVLASSSTLYAGHQEVPFKEDMDFRASKTASPYALSKFAAESIASSFHHQHGVDISILRYFSVYGPFGRPDMIVYRLIDRIEKGLPVEVYGDGRQSRDFTHVDDIASGTIDALRPLGLEVINLGSGGPPVAINHVIEMLEDIMGRRAIKCPKPSQRADMPTTWADIAKARRLLSWVPKVSLASGLQLSVNWYRTLQASAPEIMQR